MKKISIFLISFVVCFFVVEKGYADTKSADQKLALTVKGSALLAVDGGDITMSLAGANVAGEAAGSATNVAFPSFLRMTSLVDAGITRVVNVKISNLMTTGTSPVSLSDMPASNTKLTLTLGDLNENASDAAANFGTKKDPVVLSTTAKNLIEGITTCWTGAGLNSDGYPISYLYEKDGDNPRSVTLTVVYTISDAVNDLP